MQNKDIIEQYKRELEEIVEKETAAELLEREHTDEENSGMSKFSRIENGRGKLLYESFSDEELCKILREAVRRLGHVPAQKEVHWIYRL